MMKRFEIFEVVTEWVQQEYGPLSETFLANLGDMFELLAEDIPIPWPQYYFLLDQKLFIVLEEDWRFVFLVLECLDFLDKGYGSEGLKSRRIILKYLMDFWQKFCQYVADRTSKTKDKFPEPPELITFQEWVRFKTCIRHPPPPFDEWRDAQKEEQIVARLEAEGVVNAWEVVHSLYLRRRRSPFKQDQLLTQWEMQAIFEVLEMKEKKNEGNFSKIRTKKSNPIQKFFQNSFYNVQSNIFWILSFILINYLFMVTGPSPVQKCPKVDQNIATFRRPVSSGKRTPSVSPFGKGCTKVRRPKGERCRRGPSSRLARRRPRAGPSTARGRSAKKGRPKVASRSRRADGRQRRPRMKNLGL